MAQVKFTSALARFIPGLKPEEIGGNSIREIMDALAEKYPNLNRYVLDEKGALRKHVNIFLNNELIKDKENLSDKVSENDEIYIIQALSGG